MGETLGLLAIGLVVIAGVVAWQRRRARMYDLRFWTEEEWKASDDDGVDEDSGPYCHLCDHPNPPGTHFCQSCGQKIA